MWLHILSALLYVFCVSEEMDATQTAGELVELGFISEVRVSVCVCVCGGGGYRL